MHVLLKGVVGSHVYGLATPSSDVDRLGIYAAPTEDLHGFHPEGALQSIQTHDPDLTMHEVGKYLELALKGNPTALELLWLPEYDVRTPWGHYVQVNRQMLLSKRIKASHGGYVLGQLNRIDRRIKDGLTDPLTDKRIAKHGRHCFRLILQGQSFLLGGNVDLRLDEQQAAAAFAMGRQAQEDYSAFKAQILAELRMLDEIADYSPLPDHPDEKATEWMLRQIRLAYLPSDVQPIALRGMEYVPR